MKLLKVFHRKFKSNNTEAFQYSKSFGTKGSKVPDANLDNCKTNSYGKEQSSDYASLSNCSCLAFDSSKKPKNDGRCHLRF